MAEDEERPVPPDSRHRFLACWITGGAILLFLAAVVFLLPEPNEFQRTIIRFLMAIAGGLLSYFFVGEAIFHGRGGKAWSLGGGFAIFLIVFGVFDPFVTRTAVADVTRGLVPQDRVILQAEQALARLGYNTGRVDGEADSDTRDAIRQFQLAREMDADGYAGEATLDALRNAVVTSEDRPAAARTHESPPARE